MKLNKVLGTFDCELIDSIGDTCVEIQVIISENRIILKYTVNCIDDVTRSYKSNIPDFEYKFKINLSEEPEFVKLLKL